MTDKTFQDQLTKKEQTSSWHFLPVLMRNLVVGLFISRGDFSKQLQTILGLCEGEPYRFSGQKEQIDKQTDILLFLLGLLNQVGIRKYLIQVMTKEEVAMGFIAVANEAMCRPIRKNDFQLYSSSLYFQVKNDKTFFETLGKSIFLHFNVPFLISQIS